MLDRDRRDLEVAHLQPPRGTLLPVGHAQLVEALAGRGWELEVEGEDPVRVADRARPGDGVAARVAQGDLDLGRREGGVVLAQAPADPAHVHGLAGAVDAALGVDEEHVLGEGGRALVGAEPDLAAAPAAVDDHDPLHLGTVVVALFVVVGLIQAKNQGPAGVRAPDLALADIDRGAGGRASVGFPGRDVHVGAAARKELEGAIDRDHQPAPLAERGGQLGPRPRPPDEPPAARVGELVGGGLDELERPELGVRRAEVDARRGQRLEHRPFT